MPNTELHDLVASLGAVYWQDPQVEDGYVLSGSDVTHIVNLIDTVQVVKAGTRLIGIGEMCDQPAFLFNVSGAAGDAYIRRTSYSAVVPCLQTDFTLFFTCEPLVNGTVVPLFGYGSAGVNPSFLQVLVTRASSPSSEVRFAVDKRKVTGGGTESHLVTGLSVTHHVFEVLCTNTTWELIVDGVSQGSGAWANSGTAWSTLANFQEGARGHSVPTDGTLQHLTGQMALFPSVLSSGDRALVRDAMTLIMCNGHPTGDNAPWWGTEF